MLQPSEWETRQRLVRMGAQEVATTTTPEKHMLIKFARISSRPQRCARKCFRPNKRQFVFELLLLSVLS